jgi:hypothetical protein
MRWLVVALAFAALAVPASAASIDPRLFVLGRTDVPGGYVFDWQNSMLLSRAMVDQSTNEESRLLRRLGFQGAYLATYLNTAPPKWKFLHSGAYVFRDARGARAFVRFARDAGLTPFDKRGGRVDLGDEAWVYPASSSTDGTTVVWRFRRVVAYVSGTAMARHRAVVLAHATRQQRRIAAALR